MIESTIFGLIIGGLTRIAPEIFRIISKIIDNKHELTMLKASNITAENTAVYKEEVHNSPAPDYGMIDRIIAIQAPTGNKKVDIINMLVRPTTTYIIIGLYALVKLYFLFTLDVSAAADLLAIWNKDDMALLGAILNFWFLGRVFDKR